MVDTDVFTSKMRHAMQEFTTAWSKADIDGLMALFGDEPLYRTSSGTTFKGRAEVQAGLIRMCQPSVADPAPASEARMQFWDHTCVAYWRLDLPNGNAHGFVDGLDIITFDDTARIIVKDAYRKLA